MTRFATWNVNSLNARLGRVEQWIADIRPDILCMQETKLADEAFPAMAFEALGYESAHHGEGRWNGVGILSRVGLTDVTMGFDDGLEPDSEARVMTARCGDVAVVNVYVPNGRSLDHEQYQYKLSWLERLGEPRSAASRKQHDAVILAGDFNIAPTDIDVYDPAVFDGATHVSPAERAVVRAPRRRRLARRAARRATRTSTGCSRGGTTAAATSTRAAACASTSSWPPRRSPSASRGASSTATPARASSRATTPR